MDKDESDYIMISALQHYSFCPRQCGLIHIEQVWSDNFFTAQGHVLHEKVDSGRGETRKDIRFERSSHIVSHKLKIKGRLDLLEVQKDEKQNWKVFRPVEYKKGKVKVENHDRIQLCAQVFCIEEMEDVSINEASLWYWEERKREHVEITKQLKDETLEVVRSVYNMIQSGITPKGVLDKKCRSCSLYDLCGISYLEKDESEEYVKGIFKT